MLISSRGRYALRVMVDLAEHSNGGYLAMKDVAERQNISLKYLERILPLLVKNGLLEGMHGRGGGYRLVRGPEEYSIGEILRLTEGELVPVVCLEDGAAPCGRASDCRTVSMWTELNSLINDFFDKKTIADLMNN